jgi:Sushi repeat (SCR repeat)
MLHKNVFSTAILCPAVPQGTNITANTSSQLFGTVVSYQCRRGHYVNPNTNNQYNSLSIECLNTKQWNFTNIPNCYRKCGFSIIFFNDVVLSSSKTNFFNLHKLIIHDTSNELMVKTTTMQKRSIAMSWLFSKARRQYRQKMLTAYGSC